MTKDIKLVTKREDSKKQKNKRKQDAKKEVRKANHSDDDDDFIDTDDEEEEEMDAIEYKKFLKQLFPSKHLDKQVKMGDKLKRMIEDTLDEEEDDDDDEYYSLDEEEDDDDDEEEEQEKYINKKRLNQKVKDNKVKDNVKDKNKNKGKDNVKDKNKKDKKRRKEEEDDDSEESDKKDSKFNIVFTIGGATEDEEDWEDYDSDYDDIDGEETEDEDEDVSTVSSDTSDEDDLSSEEDDDDDEPIVRKKGVQKSIQEKNVQGKSKGVQSKEKEDEIVAVSTEEEAPDEEILKQLMELQCKNKKNPILDECIRVCQEKIDKKQKHIEKKQQKRKDKNERIFKRILRDKNTTNDYTFFSCMDTEKQKSIIKQVREINKISRIEKPYRISLLESDIPASFKAVAMKKITTLRYMEPGSGEYYKIKSWVDSFMRIPFGKIQNLPLQLSDGVDKCHEFMDNAKHILDAAVYGLNDAKMQIMQMLGQLITNPAAIGSSVAIHGPPGTGKTSLVKEGISKILNRPFAFIALGGATDSSFLEGHSYTYEGSIWGKIVQILIDSKCMNPVIYFDELDKISDTPKGEEIAGILTHLTDTTQNSQFHDKYFSEIDFDLSKCLFIFSYNDESKVNPILKDRMYRIQTKGYNQKQKTVIGTDYLLPRIRDQVKFAKDDIVIPDETLHYIIDNYCNKEDGVRNLKRCMEIIHTKLNLYRLMKPDSNLFEEDMSLKVTFPFTVTRDIADKLIKKDREENLLFRTMYI
jgi:ATP-dependent Lon protease